MIHIYRNDTGEEIFFDGEIDLILYNPLFNDLVSHSFSIKVLNTKQNKSIFDYIHLPEIRDFNIEFDVTININNTLILLGILIFTNHSEKYLDFYFKGQNNFWSWAEDNNICDIGIEFDCVYPDLKNPLLYENFPVDPEAVNDIQVMGYINSHNSTGFLDGLRTIKIPMFKMDYLISECINAYGLAVIKNEVHTHDDLNSLIIINENSNSNFGYQDEATSTDFDITIDEDEDIYIFTIGSGTHNYEEGNLIHLWYMIKNGMGYLHKILDKTDEISIISATSFSWVNIKPSEYGDFSDAGGGTPTGSCKRTIMTRSDGIEQSANHLPDITVKDFLKKCEKLGAFTIFVNESQRKADIKLLKNIINNKEYINITQYAGIVQSYKKMPNDGFKISFADGSDDYFSNQVNTIEDYMTEQASVSTYDDLPMTGNNFHDIRLVEDEDNYYIWKLTTLTQGGAWQFLTKNFKAMIQDGGEYEYNIEIIPLIDEETGVSFARYFVGRWDSAISFITYGQEIKSILRFVFDRSTGYPYKATSGRLSRIWYGTPEYFGNLDGRIEGDYGWYEQLLKDWINFRAYHYSEEERKINWPLWMLNSIDWSKKYKVNNMLYFIKSIQLKASAKDIEFDKTVLIPAIN